MGREGKEEMEGREGEEGREVRREEGGKEGKGGMPISPPRTLNSPSAEGSRINTVAIKQQI
jgi:hypothetical protein